MDMGSGPTTYSQHALGLLAMHEALVAQLHEGLREDLGEGLLLIVGGV